MAQLTELKEELCRRIRHFDGLENTAVIAEFPAGHKPTPLTRPRISVGFRKVTAAAGKMETYLGEDETGVTTGRQLELTLGLEIAVPASQDGGLCHSIFESLCQGLMLSGGDWQMDRMECGEIRYDKDTGGCRMTVTAGLELMLTEHRPQQSFERFAVEAVLTEKGGDH